MEVKNLQAKQGFDEITLQITEVAEPREFNKFGKTGKVANAVGNDASGKVKVTLWNEQVDQVKAGDTIIVKNGYANEWQGEIQISTGRNGTIEVKEGASPSEPAPDKKEDSDVQEEEV